MNWRIDASDVPDCSPREDREEAEAEADAPRATESEPEGGSPSSDPEEPNDSSSNGTAGEDMANKMQTQFEIKVGARTSVSNDCY